MSSEPSGFWVYGVLGDDAPGPPACRGVDGRHGVELIRHAGLAAVASEVPLERFGETALHETLEDLDSLELLARGHAHVLDEALVIGPVVPFGLCAVFRSADGVRRMLERERESLAAALRRLRGMAEWGVKAYLMEPPRPVPARAPASGAEYLARKRDARADESTREAALDAVHRRLSQYAAGASLNAIHDRRIADHEGRMALNGSYLVPNADAEVFEALVAELADRHHRDGIALELTGPWPAYHFSESQTS